MRDMLLGLRSLLDGGIIVSLRSTASILLHPMRTAKAGASPLHSAPANDIGPYSMLALSFLVSFLRLTRDPAAKGMYDLIGVPTSFVPVAVVISAVSAVAGAILIPHFWHHVLHIPMNRERFVRAMICVYAAVVMVWDAASWLWIGSAIAGTLPVWFPETLKTGIITAYCSTISTILVRKEREKAENAA